MDVFPQSCSLPCSVVTSVSASSFLAEELSRRKGTMEAWGPPLSGRLPPTLLSTQQSLQGGVSGQDLEQLTGDLVGLIPPP